MLVNNAAGVAQGQSAIPVDGVSATTKFSVGDHVYKADGTANGFVASTVGMWRQRRQNYASLCGSTRNLCVQIQASLAWDESGETTKLRETLSRWVLLAYELAVLKPRNAMDSDGARDHLKAVGLLEADSDHLLWNNNFHDDFAMFVVFLVLVIVTVVVATRAAKVCDLRHEKPSRIAKRIGVSLPFFD